jgi:hypothetical protein
MKEVLPYKQVQVNLATPQVVPPHKEQEEQLQPEQVQEVPPRRLEQVVLRQELLLKVLKLDILAPEQPLVVPVQNATPRRPPHLEMKELAQLARVCLEGLDLDIPQRKLVTEAPQLLAKQQPPIRQVQEDIPVLPLEPLELVPAGMMTRTSELQTPQEPVQADTTIHTAQPAVQQGVVQANMRRLMGEPLTRGKPVEPLEVRELPLPLENLEDFPVHVLVTLMQVPPRLSGDAKVFVQDSNGL